MRNHDLREAMSVRRMFRAVCAGLLSLGMGSLAAAQDYPARTITLIVPFAAGGPTDMVARVVGEHMSKTLGRQIVIENVVGAGGTTGTSYVMRATPDGYTIGTGNMGTHAAAVALYPGLPYDPAVDFEPIGQSASTPFVILARKDFPARDLREFVAYVKSNADKLNMAHAGVGSVSFITCGLLNSLLDAKPTLVPYNGTAPAMNALVAGQVDYMCDQIANVVPEVVDQTIKAYAIATAVRNPALPDIPTTREGGLPEFEFSAWNGLFAPKGTPKPVLDALTDALDKALSDKATRKRLREHGSDVPDGPRRGQQALATLVKNEIARWVPFLKAAAASSHARAPGLAPEPGP